VKIEEDVGGGHKAVFTEQGVVVEGQDCVMFRWYVKAAWVTVLTGHVVLRQQWMNFLSVHSLLQNH
jgi:hypothetical protein